MKVALVTDSTADLPPGWAEAHGVRVVPLYLFLDGKTYKDGVDITPDDLIQAVQSGKKIPTTSQPTPEDFRRAYADALKEADHVLSIHISSKLSGTVRSASLAASEFSGKVSVFDTLAASAGIGLMVMRAHELLSSGATLPRVQRELERIRDDQLLRFSVATLEFLQKNGRIGKAAALVGSFLRIKPILTLNQGVVEPAGRARGEKKALMEMVKAFKAWAEGKPKVRAAFLYAGNPEAVLPLKEALFATSLPIEEVYTGKIGAVITSHVGPGTYGYYAYALES